MSLIDDNILPVDLVQPQPIFQYKVVGGQTDIPFGRFHNPVDFISGCRIATIDDLPDGRRPFLELVDPVGHGRQGHHYQKRPIVLLELNQVRQQRYRLDSLPQPHLIRQYSVQVVIVQRNQPLQPHQLVILQLPTLHYCRLLLYLLFHSVRQVVIHVVRTVESREHVIFRVLVTLLTLLTLVLVVALLDQHLRSQLFQKLVCLTQKLLYLVVLSLLHQLEILCHVLLLQSL